MVLPLVFVGVGVGAVCLGRLMADVYHGPDDLNLVMDLV